MRNNRDERIVASTDFPPRYFGSKILAAPGLALDFDRFAYAVSHCVATMVDEPVWQRVGEVRVPVLILAGKNDNHIPNSCLRGGKTRDVMERGVSQFPDARLEMLPCSGHMIQLEAFDKVNEEISGFAAAK